MLKSKQIKWMFAVLVFITTVGMVRQTLSETIYLPVIIAQASQTPTPTPTLTPSPTSTATPDGVLFADVVNSVSDNPLDEYVSIYNHSYKTANLTGWFIRDDGEHRFDFPANFYIGGRQTVRIWTTEGANTTTDLYWGSETEVWNDFGDCAYLRDDSDGEKLLIDIYCYSKNENGVVLVTPQPD